MHSCEVKLAQNSLVVGLAVFNDEKVELFAQVQLLGMVLGRLQVVGAGGGDGFEPLSLQDRKPPKHRMYHHHQLSHTHACACVSVLACKCMCLCLHACMHVCVRGSTHVHVMVYVCVCVQWCMHVPVLECLVCTCFSLCACTGSTAGLLH